MTTAPVVETSVTVNKNSPIQDYVHPDDQTSTYFYYSYYKMSNSSHLALLFKVRNKPLIFY